MGPGARKHVRSWQLGWAECLTADQGLDRQQTCQQSTDCDGALLGRPSHRRTRHAGAHGTQAHTARRRTRRTHTHTRTRTVINTEAAATAPSHLRWLALLEPAGSVIQVTTSASHTDSCALTSTLCAADATRQCAVQPVDHIGSAHLPRDSLQHVGKAVRLMW